MNLPGYFEKLAKPTATNCVLFDTVLILYIILILFIALSLSRMYRVYIWNNSG